MVTVWAMTVWVTVFSNHWKEIWAMLFYQNVIILSAFILKVKIDYYICSKDNSITAWYTYCNKN